MHRDGRHHRPWPSVRPARGAGREPPQLAARLAATARTALVAVVAAACVPASAAADEAETAIAACNALGEAILRDNPVRAAVYRNQLSRYDSWTDRCYVEMHVETTAAGAGSDRVGRFLYDGDTGELLAFAETRDGHKSGRVFDLSHPTTTFENSGWDDAVDYIAAMMTPESGD